MTETTAKFAGADWVQASLKVKNMSPIGDAAADILGEVWRGIYHIPDVKDVDWSNPNYISVPIGTTLSTWDFDHLTRLVVLAHDRCVRIEVAAGVVEYRDEDGVEVIVGAKLFLLFHPRKREGRMMERHPTLEEAVARVRGTWPPPEKDGFMDVVREASV